MIEKEINNKHKMVLASGKMEPAGITVMMASDKNYLYPTMILLTSLFHNHRNQKVTVYLLQMGFSKEDLEGVYHFADSWNNKEINCISITSKELGTLKAFGRFSVAAYFRILGMFLLPESITKVLYLDVDMVVNHNLSGLFSMQMDTPMAVCYDINNYLQGNIEYHKELLEIPAGYPYFNSGMLMMDLEYMRKHRIAEKLLADIEEHFEVYSLVDQDALNRYFYNNVTWLPWQEYNCPCIPFFSSVPEIDGQENLIGYKELTSKDKSVKGYDITAQLIEDAGIIHFCTSQKPWRDRDFYEQENMRTAMKIYQRYEKLYFRKNHNKWD